MISVDFALINATLISNTILRLVKFSSGSRIQECLVSVVE